MGWLASVLLRQNYEDRLAIAIEAGIQNTGIAIFVLRYALPQPEADLTTVVSFVHVHSKNSFKMFLLD